MSGTKLYLFALAMFWAGILCAVIVPRALEWLADRADEWSTR